MEQMPQYRTKMCRFGATCRNLARGNCTFAHSTQEQRTYFNAWIDAKYYVVTLVNNTISQYLSFRDKAAAISAFTQQCAVSSRTRQDESGVKCKDSFLFVPVSAGVALMLTGLPKQENREVLRNILSTVTPAEAARETQS
jgi:hypothetical protein